MADIVAGVPIAIESVPRRAIAAVGVAIALWTTNVFFVRHADDVLVFTAWRMVLALPVMAATACAVRWRKPEDALRREPLRGGVRVAVAGVGVLFGLSAFVNFVSINETTLVNVGVIHALQPAVVAVVAGRYLGEIVDWHLLARAGVAIGGASLVAAASTGTGSWSLHGDLLAVLGLALNCVWFLAGRWVRTRTEIDATTYMAAVFGTAAVALVALAVALGRDLAVSGEIVVYAALTALLGTVGHTMIAWAHRFVPAAISSLFLLSQPALIAVLAWIAFDEGLTTLHVGGGAMVTLSLARIVTRSRAESPPVPPGDLPDARDDLSAGEES